MYNQNIISFNCNGIDLCHCVDEWPDSFHLCSFYFIFHWQSESTIPPIFVAFSLFWFKGLVIFFYTPRLSDCKLLSDMQSTKCDRNTWLHQLASRTNYCKCWDGIPTLPSNLTIDWETWFIALSPQPSLPTIKMLIYHSIAPWAHVKQMEWSAIFLHRIKTLAKLWMHLVVLYR